MCILRSPGTIAAAASSYRLALDHPGRLSQLAVLDILPTYDYWERMNRLYALKIYHWSFLAQPFPLPETLIGGNPDFFLKQKMASQTKSKKLDAIDPRALEHYLARSAIPRGCTRCARTTAPAPMPISRSTRPIATPARRSRSRCWRCGAMPASRSAAATPLETWKKWATKVSGAPIDSGHFLTEENPDATAKALREFFVAS